MQEEFINNLVCKKVEPGDTSVLEDLSNFNCGAIDDAFYHVSNNMLDRFKNYILNAPDSEDITDIYYIVRDDDDIYLFFSLQASSVFYPGTIKPEDFSHLQAVYELSKDNNNEFTSVPDYENFTVTLKSFGISYDRYDSIDIKDVHTVGRIIQCKNHDKQNNIYVDRSVPCVEMVNFCKNHGLKEKWNSKGIKTSIGATLFWYKILPIIEKVHNIIGCEYFYLFAANVSSDETDGKNKLISYYENALMLNSYENINVIKPQYDWECVFLCQKISVLCDNREEFKRTFLSGLSEDDV